MQHDNERRPTARALGSMAALALALVGLLLTAGAQGDLAPAAFLPLIERDSLVMTTRTPTATPTATFIPTLTPSPTPDVVQLQIDTIQAAGPDEWITIRHLAGPAQAMQGWIVQSYDSGSPPCQPLANEVFHFPDDFVHRAGDVIRVHSGPVGGALPRTATDLPWTTAEVWGDVGDRGDVRSPLGTMYDFYVYGSCR